ncbi:PfkB family carbohydrate kinase [Nonomuraea sp. NPDC050786]|uniref:PfkB family carbohydrate kinase n=1 Tax=Nonomuraea sp. NPDC050786 TaxID=3154840 RepID=UPI0033C3828B
MYSTIRFNSFSLPRASLPSAVPVRATVPRLLRISQPHTRPIPSPAEGPAHGVASSYRRTHDLSRDRRKHRRPERLAGGLAFTAVPGGSPLNVAVTLAGLGRPTRYVSEVHEDMFGDFLRDHLTRHGCRTDELRGTQATNLAIPRIGGDGSATYDFGFGWRLVGSVPLDGSACLHTGSLATLVGGGAEEVGTCWWRGWPGRSVGCGKHGRCSATWPIGPGRRTRWPTLDRENEPKPDTPPYGPTMRGAGGVDCHRILTRLQRGLRHRGLRPASHRPRRR